MLDKVRALLRKAENPAVGEEEARAYLDKATELMAKYGIEQAMLDDGVEHAGPVDRIIDLCPPYVKEVRRLLSWIGSEMRCRSVYPGDKDNKHRVHLFGFESDIHASEVLFASLRLQMLDGADRADRLHRPGGEDARACKRSWMLGFIREVTARVGLAQQAARTAAEREAEPAVGEEGGRSVALVLADRTSEVDSRLATHYPKLRKPSPTKFKGTGYRQGIADGRNADIGSPAFGEGGWPGWLGHRVRLPMGSVPALAAARSAGIPGGRAAASGVVAWRPVDRTVVHSTAFSACSMRSQVGGLVSGWLRVAQVWHTS
ncbi:DUF2786 domain-containing protein [Streptomyces avidinii]|uniref:DUF2786 domain-containing protein n=1 Tax=Streptomyces avidinii TaxID=1895 RepID=UPI0038663514|nr:DUF2786 domain-containing protein [Streptomyces avidinii]